MSELLRDAADLVLFLREDMNATPEEVQASVRHDFPTVSMVEVFRRVTRLEQEMRGAA